MKLGLKTSLEITALDTAPITPEKVGKIAVAVWASCDVKLDL